MIRNFLFLAHSDYNFLLRTAGNRAGRMKRVAYLREHAIMILEKAIARIPAEKPSIIAAYRAKGIEPVWVLENDDDAKRFCCVLRDFDPTSAETEAAELLRACVAAQEDGDVIEFARMQAAIRQSEGNKLGGNALKKMTVAKEKKIAKRYWERVANGEKYGAVKELSCEFDVTRPTIYRIIEKYKPDSIVK